MNDSGRGKASNPKNKNLGEALVSVVDDDRLMRSSTGRLLLADGFRVEAFASAEEFLASGLVEETACLILDLRMPGMNGLELQCRLARDFNLFPITFLSAHGSTDDERRALKAGAVEFLQKPVDKDVLLLAIRNALKTPSDEKPECARCRLTKARSCERLARRMLLLPTICNWLQDTAIRAEK